jgi:hypothetical protein
MNKWVWSNGGMILTGEMWSTGRGTLYSVCGRWISEYGAVVKWCWKGKTKVLGEEPLPVPLRPPKIRHGMDTGQSHRVFKSVEGETTVVSTKVLEIFAVNCLNHIANSTFNTSTQRIHSCMDHKKQLLFPYTTLTCSSYNCGEVFSVRQEMNFLPIFQPKM